MPLSGVRLLVLDADGVLTDGTLGRGDDGVETKTFSVADGLGIRLAAAVGIETAIISGRASEAVAARARELNVREIHLGVGDKLLALGEVLARCGIEACQAAYLGDDIPDLPILERVGAPLAVRGAPEVVQRAAIYTTRAPGGRGAVREVVEKILRVQGRFEEATRRYLENLRSSR